MAKAFPRLALLDSNKEGKLPILVTANNGRAEIPMVFQKALVECFAGIEAGMGQVLGPLVLVHQVNLVTLIKSYMLCRI